MNKQQTITINGVKYDAHTGMRQSTASPALSQAMQPTAHARPTSRTLHSKTGRTRTLNRQHVHAPHQKTAPTSAIVATQPKQVIAKSPMVRRFAQDVVAPNSRPVSVKSSPTTPDVAPIAHPAQVRAQSHVQTASRNPQAVAQRPQPKPAREIKQRAITEAMKKAVPQKRVKKSFLMRHPRTMSIASASIALVLLAGYLTYINLPSLSVRVAAAQAGVAATYPSYQPSGYSLKGPVAFSNGEVSMKFVANAGPEHFSVDQVSSNWDSSALLDNYVTQASHDDYTTYTDSGLTIYVYDTNAAWVNDGILHVIKGDAPLTNNQIRHIATSM